MSDAERRRIAAELHDGAMQELTLARLQLDLLSAGMRDSPQLLARLQEASATLGEVCEGLQALMTSLAPLDIVQTSR